MATTDEINRETNARFWAQTNYKPGQKLDMTIPQDRAMAKVWNKIKAQVVAEDRAGALVLTFHRADVAEPIAAQAAAGDVADFHEASAQAAAAAGDAQAAAAHAEAATVAAQAQHGLAGEAQAAQAAAVQASPQGSPRLPRGDWSMSDYDAAADATFARMRAGGALAAVISFGKNGQEPANSPFSESAAASSAYDVVVEAPTDRWYVALYDREKSATPNGRVDVTYFGGIQTVQTVKRPIGAIVATGIAAGLAVFAGRKHRRRAKGVRS